MFDNGTVVATLQTQNPCSAGVLYLYHIVKSNLYFCNMLPVISKEELMDLIIADVDYDYEIFLRIDSLLASSSTPLSQLPKIYQMIYSTTMVEGEIYNGGFYQYYGNPTAEEYNVMGIEGFKLIGAKKTADVLIRAFRTIVDQSSIFKNEHGEIGIQNAFEKASIEYDQIHIEEFNNYFYTAAEEEDIKNSKLNFIKKVAFEAWIE